MAEALAPSLRKLCVLTAFSCALPMLFQVSALLVACFVAITAVGFFSAKPLHMLVRLLLTGLVGGMVMVQYEFGVGRDAASAALVAMLLMKTLETHGSRDARSLIGFSLFAPFAAFLQDQGPLMLALSIPAVAMVLLAANALTSPHTDAIAGVGTRLRAVGIMLALALPLALVGFWLFPRLGTPLWGLPGKSLQGGGLGDRMNPNDWLDTLVDDRTAFRVRFIGAEPARAQLYWRGPVLWDFDGEIWSRGDFDQFSSAPTLSPIGASFSYELMLEPTERHYLPTLDFPVQAPEGSRLNADLTAYRREPVQNLISYRASAAPDVRFDTPLPALQRQRALRLPPGRNPRSLALAKQWRAESASPEAYAERVLDWIRADFKYSISAPPLGRDSADDFLFNTREGFCQHFSSSFVVLMRAAGVPARVVTGYAGGYKNRYDGYWSLYVRDAHAWAEIWVDGRGWLRVDPTAAVAPENILDTLTSVQGGDGLLAASGGLSGIFDFSDSLKRSWNEFVLGFNAARQQSLLRPVGINSAERWQLLLTLAIGAGIALAITLAVLLRQHAGTRDPVERAWRNFTSRIARGGHGKRDDEPAQSYGERLAAALPGQAETLLSLSRRYAAWRYAAARASDEQARTLAADLNAFRLRRNRNPP